MAELAREAKGDVVGERVGRDNRMGEHGLTVNLRGLMRSKLLGCEAYYYVT
jgi:hypothetical protein